MPDREKVDNVKKRFFWPGESGSDAGLVCETPEELRMEVVDLELSHGRIDPLGAA